MGQRYSDLKIFFGAMEGKDPNELNTTVDISSSCLSGNVGNIPARLSERQSSDNNGNDEAAAIGLNEHFENIYSNSENSKSVEENGNIADKPSLSNAIYDEACSSRSVDSHCCKTESSTSVKENSCSSSLTRKVSCQKQPNRQKNFHKLLKLHKEMNSGSSKKKRSHWVLRFNCARLKSGSTSSTGGSENDIAEPNVSCNACVCTGYRRTEDGVVLEATSSSVQQGRNESSLSSDSSSSGDEGAGVLRAHPVIDLTKFNPEDYPIEDCDERARVERAREIAEGVEPPPGFRPGQHIQLLFPSDVNISNLTALLNSAALTALTQLDVQRIVHTQVDYIHCLVPDLLQITSCSFYWGKMDRYEAERLLESRPEGTFLLRDSAQEEYLFSVSFRKYGRSLHARIEQWNHHFSFDSHDPGVYASSTVCGLIEHYKDPSCCMFFEPMLTIPLHRIFPFPLQHLCRAVVCNLTSYDGISQLRLPKTVKSYLKEYHYKQRIRVRRFDAE